MNSLYKPIFKRNGELHSKRESENATEARRKNIIEVCMLRNTYSIII